jgi:hypothetical protein
LRASPRRIGLVLAGEGMRLLGGVLRHHLQQAAALEADDPLLSAMIRRGTRFDTLDAG